MAFLCFRSLTFLKGQKLKTQNNTSYEMCEVKRRELTALSVSTFPTPAAAVDPDRKAIGISKRGIERVIFFFKGRHLIWCLQLALVFSTSILRNRK